ncbi:SulP family inorganic anion transporter [Streptomyces sp. NPDC091376]|uniref:SulP family inorganic anion transporter n=1 Tax=Streptomyces sp. NPDC091376 TaxID=3365994 RepID=UPI0038197F1E
MTPTGPTPLDAAPPPPNRRRWPVASWLPGYKRTELRGDVRGALIAWALIVPESVAYAHIAGVPPQNAFYAAPLALIAYVLLGSSRYLIVGATSAAAALSGATVVGLTGGDPAHAVALSSALALLTGVLLLVASFARLGFLADFVAEPALVGFLFGMALTIIMGQFGKLFGVPAGQGDFFENMIRVLSQAEAWSWATVAVGAAALLALLLLGRFTPRLPASLIVLALGITVCALWNLGDHGVAVVGDVPAALPTLAWPDVSPDEWLTLLGGACGLALVAFVESYSIAAGLSRRHGKGVDAGREMASLGVANLAAGLVRGFAVSGSASRSAASEAAGARSPMTSAIAATLVLLTAAFLTPVFTDLPEPVLAAIVIVAVRRFLRVAELRRYWHHDRAAFAVATAALLGVLIFDLLPGLLLAVALSLALFIGSASRPHLSVLGHRPTGQWGDIAEHANAVPTPGLLVLRPEGALFFGNTDRVKQRTLQRAVEHDPRPDAIILDLGASYRLDLTVLDALEALRQDLARHAIALHLARVRAHSRRTLDAHPLGPGLGPGHVHTSVEGAADAVTETGEPR